MSSGGVFLRAWNTSDLSPAGPEIVHVWGEDEFNLVATTATNFWLDEVDDASRVIADELLRERYMVPFVTEIRAIRQEFGAWVWDVVTDRGERTFTVRNPREDIRPVPVAGDGMTGVRRIRISDADGNVYEIRDYNALGARSRSLFDRIA